MLRNYFKIGVRSLAKHRIFTLINVSGLAIGFACCILIGVYISDELSYDRFHQHADKTYRLTREFKSPDGSTSLHLSRLAPPFVPLLKTDFPEMEMMTRFIQFGGPIRYEDKLFDETNIGWADNHIFDVFSFEFVSGNPEEALAEPNSMVISEEIEQKYFEDESALGKVLKFNNQASLKITGVFKEMPENSHFQMDMIGDFANIEAFYGGRENMMKAWGSNNFSTYFVIKEGATIAEIERRLPDFLIKHLGENATDWNALHVQKMTDIHLHSQLDDELGVNSDIKYVYIFTSIALLILVIAVINYMNLATAKSANRAKEVGMRKVLGAHKSSLISQFMIESLVLVFMALVLALMIVYFALPFLREFTDKSLLIDTPQIMSGFGALILFALFVGVLSGSYPAFYLSSYKALSVLKGKLTTGVKSSGIRRTLVIIQFTISAILIACTGVVYQQMNYIQNKKLGYQKDRILTFRISSEIEDKIEVFKNELIQHPNINSASTSSRIPTIQLLDSQRAQAEVDGETITPEVVIKALAIDHDFLETYQMELTAGRNFSRDFISDDTTAFILNEAAQEMIGWESPEDAVGKGLTYAGQKGKVIGITKNIHFETLQTAITPMVMYLPRRNPNWISVSIGTKDLKETVSFVEGLWASQSPNSPIRYRFLDERFETLYASEAQRSNLFTLFSFLAIFLACLGLFGLASFTVSRRSKEISIRKVLGASVQAIVTILSREFLILVGISILIAFPIAYLFMDDWLQSYAYRMDMNIIPFAGAGLIAILIAFTTISMQTFKAATRNPVKALKDE